MAVIISGSVKRGGVSRIVDRILTFEEGFCSMELVN
jgi:hypothetical protein